MKKIKIIFFSIIISSFLNSCKKTEEVKPSIIGIWKGKFGIGATVIPNTDVIFDIKDDGSVLVYNAADVASATVKGNGTYSTLNGGIDFAGKYIYPGNALNYSVEMATTTDYVDLKGIWKYNGTLGGKIEVKKQ